LTATHEKRNEKNNTPHVPDRQEKKAKEKANQTKPPKTFDAFILPSHE
jgi:hypothetical protein